MQGVQPQRLSTQELLRYATLMDPKDVPPAWVTEIIRRLQAFYTKM